MIILERPVITEKSMKQTTSGLYTFLVEKSKRKPEIKKEVAGQFKVDVLSVKTINMKGQRKMQRGRRGYYIKAGFKKAIVTLKQGQKIALFEKAVAPEEKALVTTAEGEPVAEVKEKKSRLKGTKIKIEKVAKESK